ncbi:unnamed protein product [Effrenium voratum]|uniref:Polycystin cation channel PKD1/PKD2 domain-containing protein n=1 Tax=Effrenium voratum TaxID=2562239 RepID=A0AA36MHY9_9DINO|nr:unnamed protein product [Effrenium voratum]CAJ1441027.1 unnamed protein product [Effrenium voratum]
MSQDAGEMSDIAMPVKRAHKVLRSVAISNSTRIVERHALKEVIEDTNRRFWGCVMLPITLAFFAFYSLSSILHEDVPSKHITEFPVRNALNPLLDEDDEPTADMLDGLTTTMDVWNYLERVFIPFFLRDTDVYQRPLPEDQRGTYLQYNQVLGGIILTLERGLKEQCEEALVDHLTCFPQDAISADQFGGNISALYEPGKDAAYWYSGNESLLDCPDEGFVIPECVDSSNFTARPKRSINVWTLDRRLAPLRQELTGVMPIQQNSLTKILEGDKGFKFTLRAKDSSAKNQKRFQYLKDRGWLDEQSLSLEAKVVAYNYQLDIPRLVKVQFNFYFSRGGGIYTKQLIEVATLKTWPRHNRALLLFVDIVFFFMCLASSAFMAREFSKDMKEGKFLGHFNAINTITWLSCGFGWAHLGMLFGLEVYRKMVMASIEDYFDFPDTFSTLEVMRLSDSMAEFSSYQRIFISYAHILFMARCFLSLQWQPRLAIITSTLKVSTVDLLHFLIVLIPTWCGFAIAGMIMFGRRMQAFSTPLSGFAMCLQLAMEGEYDWQGMSSEDWFITLLWCWIYMVLLVMVMLNMVLAIIMDVYAEVRRQQGETMSMFQHCTYLFKRAYYHKMWVPDRELWERVAEMPETIIVDDILEAYPDMPEFQLNFLCDAARNRTRVIQREGIDPTWTVQMVAAIHISLEEIMADLSKLKKRGWLGKGFEVPNDDDRNCVKEILAGVAVQSNWMSAAQKHVSWLHEQIGVEGTSSFDMKPTGQVDMPVIRPRQGND